MKDGRDENYYIDDEGNKWLSDGKGGPLTDNGRWVPSSRSKVVSKKDEFTIYDSSRGHCALCGSLYCNGNCFK